MSLNYYNQQFLFEPLVGGGNPLDIVKLVLLWVGWISVILFLVLAIVAWLSSKNIKSNLDEIENAIRDENTDTAESEGENTE